MPVLGCPPPLVNWDFASKIPWRRQAERLKILSKQQVVLIEDFAPALGEMHASRYLAMATTRVLNCDFYKVAQIALFEKSAQKLLRDPLDRMAGINQFSLKPGKQKSGFPS